MWHYSTAAPTLTVTSWQLCLPPRVSRERRPEVPGPRGAGGWDHYLDSGVPSQCPHASAASGQRKDPCTFTTLSVHVPPPVSCTAIALTKQSFGYYPKPFLQNSSEFTHGGRSDGTFGCLEKVGGVGRAGGGGCEVQRRCWM